MRRGEEAECGVTLLIAFTRKLRSDYTGSQTTSTWVLSDTVPLQWVLWEYAPGDGMHYSLSRLDVQINCRLNTCIIFLLCRTADKEADRKYKRGRKWCDMQQRSPAVNPTVGVLVAGYASWSLGHKTSQIMSCKHTTFRSLWPCWGVFHAVQHGSRNQDLDICCEKHKSERLPAGDVHVFLPWVQSYSISVDAALIKNSSAPGMTSPDTEKQAVSPTRMKPLPSYSVMPGDESCVTTHGSSWQNEWECDAFFQQFDVLGF